MISDTQNADIWERLIQNRSLEDLGLERINGLLDVRGLKFPDPKILQRFLYKGIKLTERERGDIIRGVHWSNLDLSCSNLNGMRLIGGLIENCRFNEAEFKDVRVWATTFRDSSFITADMRKSVLGGVHDGVRNSFRGIDFSYADLSGTIYEAAEFERCVFVNCTMKKIDFQSSSFVDCRFEGELDDVIFYRQGFNGEHFPPNEMINVDFSKAILRHVGFRRLNLDRVQFPENSNHIVIKNFGPVLDRMASTLQLQNNDLSRKIAAFIANRRKWVAQNQVQGVISLLDLEDVVGKDGVKHFLSVIPTDTRAGV
jgi:uncharacterized protein YjbI with pentapeptide repeats